MNRFRKFATMIDCSRNGVMTVDAVKKWIDITSDIGYNTIMLYTEDTYEIEGEPFFGYLRGRYSAEELQAIDNYAFENGMEFIPCIQTLAHLNAIFHWNEYKNIWDCTDILLVEENRTYELIDKMFNTFSKTLRTKTINIGMDEAHFLGLGKYLDKYGFKERTKILTDHLKIVAEIAKKYDFELLMWGDMFVRLANGGEYYVTDFKAPKEVKDSIPENVKIVYWDYYSFDKKRYDNQIKAHLSLKDDIWFAGGLWAWGGPTPQNTFSINANEAALSVCIENGVKDICMTIWGDDGCECSRFAILPALYHAAQIIKGITDEKSIKDGFKEKFGIAFDDFMLLDLKGTANVCDDMKSDKDLRNTDKYMLYNDCFMGQFDCFVKEGVADSYKILAQKLKELESNKEFGYLFAKSRALCELISVKYDIGVRTRKAYRLKNVEELKQLITDYDKILVLLDEYYELFKIQWMKENKPHGFDIQDVRLGGLSFRIKHCRDRLEKFVFGEIEKIEELEEEIINYNGTKSDNTDDIFLMNWRDMVSPNVI